MNALEYQNKSTRSSRTSTRSAGTRCSSTSPTAVIVSVVMGCITVMFLGQASTNAVVTMRYIDAGYTKTTLPGNCGTVWVKEAK